MYYSPSPSHFIIIIHYLDPASSFHSFFNLLLYWKTSTNRTIKEANPITLFSASAKVFSSFNSCFTSRVDAPAWTSCSFSSHHSPLLPSFFLSVYIYACRIQSVSDFTFFLFLFLFYLTVFSFFPSLFYLVQLAGICNSLIITIRSTNIRSAPLHTVCTD